MKRCTCGTELTIEDREIVDLVCGIFVYLCSKCGKKH
jgi:predicted SprT family Zn-dependent metalloprotease